MGHKGPVLRPRCIGPGRARTQIPYQIPYSFYFLPCKITLHGRENVFFTVSVGILRKAFSCIVVMHLHVYCATSWPVWLYHSFQHVLWDTSY